MQTWHTTSKLHYMVCLGSRMRQAHGDIVGDRLPGEIQERLNLLSREQEAESVLTGEAGMSGDVPAGSGRAED